MCQTSETLPPPILELFEESIYLPQAGHASPFPLPGSVEAQAMLVRSGRQCSLLSMKSGRLGSLVKMLLTSSTWGSGDASMTWRAQAISNSHSIFRIALLAYHRWNGTSGLLPRIAASDWKGVRIRSHRFSQAKERFSATGGRMVQQLRESEADGIYPDPNFCEAVKGFPDSWTELKDWEIPPAADRLRNHEGHRPTTFRAAAPRCRAETRGGTVNEPSRVFTTGAEILPW
jgi:hypothetical protein